MSVTQDLNGFSLRMQRVKNHENVTIAVMIADQFSCGVPRKQNFRIPLTPALLISSCQLYPLPSPKMQIAPYFGAAEDLSLPMNRNPKISIVLVD